LIDEIESNNDQPVQEAPVPNLEKPVEAESIHEKQKPVEGEIQDKKIFSQNQLSNSTGVENHNGGGNN
jgi:hypothetical protein